MLYKKGYKAKLLPVLARLSALFLQERYGHPCADKQGTFWLNNLFTVFDLLVQSKATCFQYLVDFLVIPCDLALPGLLRPPLIRLGSHARLLAVRAHHRRVRVLEQMKRRHEVAECLHRERTRLPERRTLWEHRSLAWELELRGREICGTRVEAGRRREERADDGDAVQPERGHHNDQERQCEEERVAQLDEGVVPLSHIGVLVARAGVWQADVEAYHWY